MARRISLVCLFTVLAQSIWAQDPDFTQLWVMPVWTNPAHVGAYNLPGQWTATPRLTLAHRNRWPNFSGAHTTNVLTLDAAMPPIRGGMGLRIVQDNIGQGTIGSREIGATYSHSVRIMRHAKVNFGLEMNYFEKSLDWNQLTFEDMVDPLLGFIYGTQETPRGEVSRGVDFATGMLVHWPNLAVGLAVQHLLEPNQTYLGSMNPIPWPRRYSVQLEKRTPINSGWHSKQALMTQVHLAQQGEFRVMQLGAQWIVDARSNNSDVNLSQFFSAGIHYKAFPTQRRSDAIAFSAGWESVSYRVQYSWDLTVSEATPNTGGAHELVFTLFLPDEDRQKRFCPVCEWSILNTKNWQPRRSRGRFDGLD